MPLNPFVFWVQAQSVNIKRQVIIQLFALVGITVTNGHTKLVERDIKGALQEIREWLAPHILVGIVKNTIGRNTSTQFKGFAFAQGLQINGLGKCNSNEKEKYQREPNLFYK